MNAAQHTPGPWRVDANGSELIDAEYHFVEAGSGFFGTDKKGFGIAAVMSIADARLITAAPDQHDLLLRINDWMRGVAAQESYPSAIRNTAAGFADDCKRVIAKVDGAAS